MNARMLGLFSGFPTRHFSGDIAARLRAALPARESLVFISAWPDESARNDEDAAGMHGMFAECGMAFTHVDVIDRRTEAAEVQRLICEAACVFLMGGNATQQMQLIREKQLAEPLRRYRGVLLGVSAGASNMARRALDIWESHMPYEGLGLADITVKAHVGSVDRQLLNTLQDISAAHRLPILAMEDDSAIFVRGGWAEWIGSIRCVNGHEIEPLTQEMLMQMIGE